MTDVARGSGAERRPLPELNTTQWQKEIVLIGETAPWMTEALQRVNAFAQLPPGWDGGRSPAIGAEVLIFARKLVVAAAQVADAPVPHLAPVSGGGVQLEWHLGGKELEIEVLPSGVVSFVQIEGKAETQGSFELERAKNTAGLVEWLVR